jgi:Flp pilus assembly protein TadD
MHPLPRLGPSRRRPALVLAALAAASLAACRSPAPQDPGAVAAAYAAAGRYEEAAREIDVAVRSHPSDVALRRQAAQIHTEAGQVDAAVGHLEAAIEVAPNDADVWFALGDLEKKRENVSDAYIAYRRAAELAPSDIRAVSGLALTADSLGFDEEARSAYDRWAELEKAAKGPEPAPASAPR